MVGWFLCGFLLVVQLHQLCHAVVQTVGEDLTLHLIILADTVVTAGGIEHPVSYVYQIQQPSELLLCQIEFHSGPPLVSNIRIYHSRLQRKIPQKKQGKKAKFLLVIVLKS